METVFLKVTSKVIAQMKMAINQEQIAIKSSSDNLNQIFSNANGNNLISIQLASAVTLKLGDTNAIWRSHNNEHKQEFDSMFSLLAEYPDIEFEFICSVE